MGYHLRSPSAAHSAALVAVAAEVAPIHLVAVLIVTVVSCLETSRCHPCQQ